MGEVDAGVVESARHTLLAGRELPGHRPVPFHPALELRGGHKQFHFDLAVQDFEGAAGRCVELGAERVAEQPGETWIVLSDPAGHPFCLTDVSAWG